MKDNNDYGVAGENFARCVPLPADVAPPGAGYAAGPPSADEGAAGPSAGYAVGPPPGAEWSAGVPPAGYGAAGTPAGYTPAGYTTGPPPGAEYSAGLPPTGSGAAGTPTGYATGPPPPGAGYATGLPLDGHAATGLGFGGDSASGFAPAGYPADPHLSEGPYAADHAEDHRPAPLQAQALPQDQLHTPIPAEIPGATEVADTPTALDSSPAHRQDACRNGSMARDDTGHVV